MTQTFYKVKDEEGNVFTWTIKEMLEEVNRDRSNEWIPYREWDWREGWNHWVNGLKIIAEDIVETPEPPPPEVEGKRTLTVRELITELLYCDNPNLPVYIYVDSDLFAITADDIDLSIDDRVDINLTEENIR